MVMSCTKAAKLEILVLVAAGILFFDPGRGYARESFELHDSLHGAYVGFSYSPALQGVTDFKIGEPFNNGTRAVIPYKHDAGAEVLRADKFDWTATDTKIAFGNSSIAAMAGSVGLAHKGARMELEVGHRSFPAHFHNESGDHDNVTGFYLLAKGLAFDVVNGNTQELRDGLAAQSPEDIEYFAHSLKASHPDIDKMICKNGQKFIMGLWGSHTVDGVSLKRGDEYGSDCSGAGLDRHDYWYNSRRASGLNAAVSGRGSGKWPNVSKTQTWYSGGKRPGVDASAQVAGEITDMNSGNKIIVARLLAKTVEGGEVVEIRSVTSTAVMVNACYDLMFVGGGSLVPYACVGAGGDFVAVAGRVTPKPAYKLKAGLSYKLSSSVYAHLGGYIHHVIGDHEYDNLPVYRLIDDSSPDGRTKDYAVASFGLSYVGCELGVRFAF
ncbi:P44/Msp2 family outer membrane protein, partial [Candidatus Anaplasma sp. TIGMIC]|uniref:P44/Msp2 family outer membrane protein n=1 Tax=Candidatus Anaplasma sp. TIGMIC TaxID=3020713 RepID=UPI00232DFEC0